MQVSAQLHQSGKQFPQIPENRRAASATVLDLRMFRSWQEMLDGDTLAQTYRELLRQTRERLPQLAAMSTGKQLAELAHSIRGAAAMMGAVAIAQIAADLELCPVPGAAALRETEQMRAACCALEAALREQEVQL